MKLIVAIFLIITSLSIRAQEHIDVAEKLGLYKIYRHQLKLFNNQSNQPLRRILLRNRDQLDQALLDRLDAVLPPPFIENIAYHLLLKRDEKKLEVALTFLMLNRFLLVKQNAENQANSPDRIERSLALLKKWSGLEAWDTSSTSFMMEQITRRAKIISDIGSAQAVVEAIEQTPIISDHLEVHTGIKTALMAEPLGPVAGNIVSMFFKNDRSLARAKQLQELEKLPSEDPARVEMANLLAEESLVKPLFDMIKDSKENMIITSPYTSGISEDALLKALSNKLESNPEWRVIFVGIGHISPRVLTVASNYKKRFAIMSIPDLPKKEGPLSWQTLIPTSTQGEDGQQGLGLLALSDTHTDTPRSFITSRIFVDHPHAYSFEQSLVLMGPAAGLQCKLLHENLKQLIPNHSDVSAFFQSKNIYPAQGQDHVRLTVDSARLGARDDRAMAMKLLLEAKEEVLVDQHLLYDRAIVDTLIKLKIKNPDLKILVLIDTNLSTGMNGLPNTIFLAEMKRYGIEIKARRGLEWEENGDEGSLQEKHGINHRNMIIRDRQFVFMGTGPFIGNFEKKSPISFGVLVSSAMSAEIADNFMRDWDNADATYELDIENFQARFDDVELSKLVSSFLNDVFALLLRAFD